jgi:hypothetical protein
MEPNTFLCQVCAEWKPLDAFPKRRGRPKQVVLEPKPNERCKTCRNKFKNRKYFAARQDVLLELAKENGLKCQCCNETSVAFLTVDHVNGGGNKERGTGSKKNYWFRILNKIQAGSKEYRILCMNCNWAVRNGDTCPHQF